MQTKQLSRRDFLRMSALSAAGVALAACAPAAPQIIKETVEVEVESTVVVQATATTAPPPEPYTVTLWSIWDLEAEMRASEIFELFAEANPGLSLDHSVLPDWETTFRTAAAAQELSDIFSTDGINISSYGCRGLITDLTDIIPAELRDDYRPPILEEVMWHGKQWGVPIECHSQGVYYNKTWLAEVGAEFPETWTDLLAVAGAVTDVDAGKFAYTYPIGAGAYAVWWEALALWQVGGRMTSEDETVATINTPECVEAITYLQTLYQKNYLPHSGQVTPGPEGTFRGQLTCMETSGSWGLQQFVKEPPDFDWGWGAVPYGSVNVQGTSGGWHWTMWLDGVHKGEAATAITWLAGDEWMMPAAERFRIISPRVSITDQFPELKEEPWPTCLEMIDVYGKVTRPDNTEYPRLADSAGRAFENAVVGGEDVQEQLDIAQEEMTRILDVAPVCVA